MLNSLQLYVSLQYEASQLAYKYFAVTAQAHLHVVCTCMRLFHDLRCYCQPYHYVSALLFTDERAAKQQQHAIATIAEIQYVYAADQNKRSVHMHVSVAAR
jgi:hypothetical protein